MNCRPCRRNKAAFTNFSSVVWSCFNQGSPLCNLSQLMIGSTCYISLVIDPLEGEMLSK